MIKTCAMCGDYFDTRNVKQKFCPECEAAKSKQLARERTRKIRIERLVNQCKVNSAQDKPPKTLDDWCREVAECGLDYGTYRTLIEMHGKTFAELKAQNRSVAHHAHGRHTRSIRDD